MHQKVPIPQDSAALTRREMLQRAGMGFGSIALIELLARTGLAGSSALAGSTAPNAITARPPHFAPRAKRVIFLFMHGGPSHLDTFDYKPLLSRDDGKPLPFAKPRVQFSKTGNLLRSPWKFKQFGQSGAWVSDLFPHVAQQVDDLTFIKSLYGSNEAHGGALLKIHTGSDTFVRPSMGSWISYGLGTENDNLPSFITITPTLGHGGVRNFGSAFLPPIHQATRISSVEPGKPIAIHDLDNSSVSPKLQRDQLDFLNEVNADHRTQTGSSAELDARIESFELAFRMQTVAPNVLDIERESKATMALYGIGEAATDTFGRKCLLARRFAQAGVRFVQCSHPYWDQHADLQDRHSVLARACDQPIAGLIQDLKSHGLLHDTLVIWGGEFGRTPTAQGKDGRDHNPHGFTWFMAGAGLKPGFSYGQTDDYGFYAVQDKVHVHDLHATILYLLGLDHERLTYRYGGRDFRLTDVSGRVVTDLFA